jgi:hypothetical protein|tara:strand:+ start:1869 stop:2126 length:258 start_codon:yes stop_codon:yes gene_type:complete
MAKVKAKKEEKITNEQLGKLQELVSKANKLSLRIGGMEAEKYSLLKNIDMIDAELMVLQQAFELDYGTSNVNIQDGTIIRNEQVN